MIKQTGNDGISWDMDAGREDLRVQIFEEEIEGIRYEYNGKCT